MHLSPEVEVERKGRGRGREKRGRCASYWDEDIISSRGERAAVEREGKDGCLLGLGKSR